LDLALWLESDRMGFLLETLDRTKLTNQRDVVRNERRQGEGTPYDVADEAVLHQLFPKTHPYYGNVIGSHADIEAARLLDVRDFFHQYYTPNNASIAIVGDFDAATIKEKVAKFFEPIPKPISRAMRMRICSSIFSAEARSAGFTRSWFTRTKLRRRWSVSIIH